VFSVEVLCVKAIRTRVDKLGVGSSESGEGKKTVMGRKKKARTV